VDGARKVLYGIIAELTVSLRLMHCKECGTLLLDKQRAYCSDGCAWRANRRTRRARERNAFVERVELEVVARRDKWICHICSEPVYSNASYTRQPTLDHVIPLSKGGEHSYENIKLAHFSCNCSKHDSMPTEAN
jgi:5-methylcytosine-specific restriction endonuclease McrA